MQLLKGKILNNRYRIKGLLGQGGFGAVYRAEDLVKGGQCAIKENLDDSPDTWGNFLREASILYNLRHPNLPEVWDHFIIPGEGQYLVMEYIQGKSLIELLDRDGKPLPEKKVVIWISQVCDALSYLHSQNPPIIHRDIKPGNIRITPDGKAVLVDFGIAKFYDQFSRTSTVARAVTPGYSPLEQYGIGRTDGRSDVYALGATTYKLLTNENPESSVDIAAGTGQPPKTVHGINPSVSLQVSNAIANAMQLKIDNRTNSVDGYKAELQSSPTITGQPGTKQKQQRKKGFPIWLAWSLAIILILILLVGAVLIFSLFA